MIRILRKAIRLLKRFVEVYEEISISKFRGPIYKEYAKENDLFMYLCFSELMGIPNPVAFHTLELYPIFYEEFHQWHIRMGMEKSPIDGLTCC